jgi:magnesium-transporting ATPase (P-type)
VTDFESRLDSKTTLKRVISVAIPITLSSSILSITNIIDLGIIMQGLKFIGYSESQATSIYGNYSTLSVPMLNLVIAVLSPISVALLPKLINESKNDVERYDKTIKFRKIRMQSFTISIGIILSYILYVVLMMNKEKLTPDIAGYLNNKNVLIFEQCFVAILLGNVASFWYILSVYRPLLPESKYAGYNSSTYKSVYKDDITDYLEHSEVHIGKFWDAEKRRNKIEKIYKITRLVVLAQLVISTIFFLILK